MIEINLKKLITRATIIMASIVMLFATLNSALAFSTLSIQPAGFSSNDQYLNGEAWLLTVSEDGNSQYAQGTINAENIKTSDGKYAQHDLTIKTNVLEQSCDYQLKQNYDTNIYKFDLQKIASGVASWDVDKYVNQCEAKSNYYWAFIADTGWVVTWDVYCVTGDKVGVPGNIKTPVTNFQSEISMTANGLTEKGTISSMGEKSIRLSNIGYAHWAGSLTSGESCPIVGAEGYNVIHDETGKWVLSKKYLYDQYISYKTNSYDRIEDAAISEIIQNTALSKGTVMALENEIEKLNYYANEATNEFGYTDFTVTSNSLSDGQAHMELSKLIQFPVITMHVKASWLGIVAPVGKPDIKSVSSEEFEEGKTGYITVKVKNVGDATASFGLSASCEDPFKQVGTALTISNLAPDSTSTKKIPITATTNKDIIKECTVSVYDLNNPNMKDTSTVSVSSYPIALCTPGDERCDGEVHKVCNNAGSAWVDSGSDKCKKPDCTRDSDCDDDDDACTIDSCTDGKCNFKYQISTECPGEELCEYKKDGQTHEEYTDKKSCCELKGGRWDPGYKAPWYNPWKEDRPATCYLPHVSILGIALIVVGIGVTIATGNFPFLVISGIGAVIQVLAGTGLI